MKPDRHSNTTVYISWWYCPNCGQTYFGDDPPDMCDFCEDFTTWKRVPRPQRYPDDRDDPPVQLPLL